MRSKYKANSTDAVVHSWAETYCHRRGKSDSDCNTGAHARCHRDTSVPSDSGVDGDRSVVAPNLDSMADNGGDNACSHPDSVADDGANGVYRRGNRNIAPSRPELVRRVRL